MKNKVPVGISYNFTQRVSNIMDKGTNIETPNFINYNKKALGSATSATKEEYQYETLGKHERSLFDSNMLDFVFSQLKVPQPLHTICQDLIGGELNITVSGFLILLTEQQFKEKMLGYCRA